MTFLGTSAALVLLLAAAHALGWPLVALLPWRLRPLARLWLSPVLGLAVLMLLLVPLGWFGPGFGRPWVRALIALPLIALTLRQLASPAWRISCLQITAFAALAAWPFTVQLLRFEAYDFLNDPWTYCVQSQWMQQHAFVEPIARDNLHGAQSQVYFTQLTGTRAGAQFLQAGTQGLFGFEWAHEAYPVAICAGSTCGALLVAFVAGLAGRRRATATAWIAGLLFAFTLNGFGLGALRGYLPQTIGLPFAAAGCTLCSWLVFHHARLTTAGALRAALVTGVWLAAATYAYSEILPFLAVGCAAPVAVALAQRVRLLPLLRTAGAIVAAFLILAAPELPRALRALVGQAKSVVGEGIPWAPLDFARHALGTHTGYTDANLPLLSSPAFATLGAALLLALAGASALRRRNHALLVPSLAILATFVAFFLHFRYRVEAPFVVGTGQSWSQYKLANWSSLFLFLAIAAGLASLRGALRTIALTVAVGIAAAGAFQAWSLADLRTAKFRAETGVERGPFALLTALAGEVRRTAQPPVFLDFPAERAKSRQLLAYLLPPGTTIADWADDVFVAWMLPNSERYAARADAHWVVRHDSAAPAVAGTTRLGRYLLSPQVTVEVARLAVRGGYPTEQHPEGSLNWVRDSIAYEYLLPPGTDATAVIEAEIVAIVPNLRVDFGAGQGVVSAVEPIDLPESHQAWARPARFNRQVRVMSGGPRKLVLEFRTTTPPGVIGGGDTRELTFFLRNLKVSLLQSTAARTSP